MRRLPQRASRQGGALLGVRRAREGIEMSGPSINRAESSGDIWTPWEFIHAIEATFGKIRVDLAASDRSRKADVWISPEMDSLTKDWNATYESYGRNGLMYLNPPYGNIEPWAKKCTKTYEDNEQVEIMLLVPASIGANWFWNWVWPYATVYSVGRMVFDNCFDRKTGKLVLTVYPKDLILCHYTNTTPSKTLQRWPWKTAKTTAHHVVSGGG